MVSHDSTYKPAKVLAIETVDMKLTPAILDEVSNRFTRPQVDREIVICNDVRRRATLAVEEREFILSQSAAGEDHKENGQKELHVMPNV